MNLMISKVLKPAFILAIISVVLFSVHQFIFGSEAQEGIYSLLKLYGFHFFITTNVYALSSLMAKHLKDQIGLVFLAMVFVKMVLLYAVFKPVFELEGQKDILLGFVAPYVIYLGIEVYLVLQVLKEVDFTNSEETKIKDKTN